MAGNNSTSVDEILAVIDATSKQQSSLVNSLVSQNEARIRVSKDKEATHREVASITERTETAKQSAALETQERTIQNAEDLGIQGMNEIHTALLKKYRADAAGYQIAQDAVDEIERDNNLLSNPVGWLKDILIGDEARAVRDSKLDRLENTQKHVQGMHAMLRDAANSNLLTAKALTKDGVRDIARKEKLLAEIKASEAETEALNYSIQGLEYLKRFGSEEYARTMDKYNIVTAAEKYEDTKNWRALQLAEAEKRRKDIESDDQFWNDTTEEINIALRQRGGEELTPEKVEHLYKSSSPMGELVRKLHIMGVRSKNSQGAVYGRTPADAYLTQLELGIPMSAATGLSPEVVKVLDQSYDELQNAMRAARSGELDNRDEFAAKRIESDPRLKQLASYGINSKNVNDQAVLYDAYNQIARPGLEALETDQTKEVNTDLLVKIQPEVKETPLYKRVLKPLEDSSSGPVSYEGLLLSTADNVAQGNISPNVAAKNIASIAQSQLYTYSAASGFHAIGNPVSLTMPVTVEIGTKTTLPFGTNITANAAAAVLSMGNLWSTQVFREEPASRTVELTDPTDVLNYFQQYRASKIKQQVSNPTK